MFSGETTGGGPLPQSVFAKAHGNHHVDGRAAHKGYEAGGPRLSRPFASPSSFTESRLSRHLRFVVYCGRLCDMNFHERDLSEIV